MSIEFFKQGGEWVQESRYPFQVYYEVYEDGVFVGIMMDRYDAPRPGWWFYVDGEDDMSNSDTSWYLCSSGDESNDKYPLAVWKFRRHYYAKVQARRMG